MRDIYLISLFFVLSCGPNNTDRQANRSAADSTTANSDTLVYTYREEVKTSPYFSENDGDIDTTYFKATYPEFSDQVANELFKPAIWVDGEQDFETAADAFISGYNEFVEEQSTTILSAPWFKDIRSNIMVNTPRILSIRTMYQQYTGGAHGNTVVIWSNFDLIAKKKIKLSDLIKEDKLADLTKRAEKEFRKMENLSDTASLSMDYFFDHGIFALIDNFGLTNESLVFYFNEYEIKPYSEGATVIELPYTDLTDILSKRGEEYISNIKR